MVHLFIQEEHSTPILLQLAGGKVAAFSTPAPNKTSPNEDAAGLLVNGHGVVLVVADGCGGMPEGEVAARIAVESLSTAVAGVDASGPGLRGPILDGIEQANRLVRKLGNGSATTIVVVEICSGIVRAYHVGDSQALLVGNRGKTKLLTRPHSPVGYAVEAGILSETDAHHHEERHMVSNVLGTLDTHIEIGPPRKLAVRDTLLVASDGLFDNLHHQEVVDVIRKGSLKSAASKLVEFVRRRMDGHEGDLAKPDDMTFLLFRPDAKHDMTA